jgi:hypothetical protein
MTGRRRKRYSKTSQIAPRTNITPHAAVTDTQTVIKMAVIRRPMMASPTLPHNSCPNWFDRGHDRRDIENDKERAFNAALDGRASYVSLPPFF